MKRASVGALDAAGWASVVEPGWLLLVACCLLPSPCCSMFCGCGVLGRQELVYNAIVPVAN